MAGTPAASLTTGLLVLVPCAILLNHRAATETFDTTLYGVQLIEQLAGGTNLVLMALNVLDGLRMAGRLRAVPAAHTRTP
jgi:hypothetical protein